MLVRKGYNKKQHKHGDMKCLMNFKVVCYRLCIKLFNVQVGGCGKGGNGSSPTAWVSNGARFWEKGA